MECLLKPENKAELVSILTDHVVPGSVTSDQTVTMTSTKTVQGQSVKIASSGSGVTVDKANVVKVDVMASNGVIRVIDIVILPR